MAGQRVTAYSICAVSMINQMFIRSDVYGPILDLDNTRHVTRFYSRVRGGYYSNNPNANGISKSVRTNNPGALNYSNWQKRIRDFAGTMPADNQGNRTTIFATPESGVAAWLHLIKHRYKFGHSGELKILELARRYAGGHEVSERLVDNYIRGWSRWSKGYFKEPSRVRFDDSRRLLLLARAMFAHEAGHASPLSDRQILFGISNHIFLFSGASGSRRESKITPLLP